MNRRQFLAATIAAAPALAAPRRIDSSRISAITDEVARTPADAIQFAHEFGLQWLSLRDTPSPPGPQRIPYYSMEPAKLKEVMTGFKNEGIKISFLDTPFLKFSLPGTTPKRSRPEEPAAMEKRIARDQALFDNRLADLRVGIRASQAFNCPMLRIFTFNRIAEPETIFPRIAEVIGELAQVAEKEGVRLLIENEASQNAGTSAETAKLMKLLPANVGINWDSDNGVPLGEKPFPDGYETLPKDRIWNVHVKGKTLLDYPEHQDWPSLFNALERDGFTGRLELETHIFGDQQVAAGHASMKEIMRLLSDRK